MVKKSPQNILLVSHYTNTPGMVHKFYDYLKEHYTVDLLLHPLYPTSPLKSTYRYNEKISALKIPTVLQYPVEWLFNLYHLLKKRTEKYSLIICFDPLSFLNTYFYKLINRKVTMVYYNLDYSKSRFSNPVLNTIYQKVNLFAFKKSDYFMCPTKKFAEDLDPQNEMTDKCFVVPHTVDAVKVKKKKRIPYSVIYSGSLSNSIEFSNLFKACKQLEKEGKKYQLDIYGDGLNKHKIMAMKDKMRLKNIVFKGTVDNAQLVNEILPQYEIGVAPYITQRQANLPDHMFHGTDLTSKLVEYIAAGLPVLSTRLYPAFDVIEYREFGMLVKSEKDWYHSLSNFLYNKKVLQKYRKNAFEYVHRYDSQKVILPLIKKFIQ